MASHFSRVWLYDPVDCSPPGSSVHGILQARILERAAIPISRRSSWSRDWTGVFCGSCIAGRPFTAEPLHLHYSLKAFSDSVVLIKWRPFSLTWFISASQFSFPTSSQMLFELVVVPQRTCFVFSAPLHCLFLVLSKIVLLHFSSSKRLLIPQISICITSPVVVFPYHAEGQLTIVCVFGIPSILVLIFNTSSDEL